MDHHHDLVATGQAHRGGRLPIEDALIRENLHLQIMIARSQGPELVDATFDGVIRDVRRVSAFEAAPLFDSIQIFFHDRSKSGINEFVKVFL